MNCEQFQQRLDDYLDGELELTQEADLHAHLDRCQECRQRLQRAEEIQAGLKAMPVPVMRPGFAQQAVAQAAGRLKPRRHRTTFLAGFGSALVAGMAMLMVVGGLLPGGRDAAPTQLQEVAIFVTTPQTVNLAFDVGYAMQDATLSLQLPEHVDVVGFPGMKRLSWRTSLTQGRNILPLPLQGSAAAGGELTATIEHNGKQKSIRIKVRVKEDLPSQVEAGSLSWV